MSSTSFLADLREHRLTAYAAMPADIREHHALEAEIAQNYRGRFVYELLQNADDAMDAGSGSLTPVRPARDRSAGCRHAGSVRGPGRFSAMLFGNYYGNLRGNE